MIHDRVSLSYVDPRRHGTTIVEEFGTTADLLSRLAEIESTYLRILDAPIGVNLRRVSTECMDVGLGGDSWIVGWCEFVEEVPHRQLFAIGDPAREGSVPFYMEEWTPLPARWLVPRDAARSAIAFWLETGKLDPALPWGDPA
jgi:hypothetical protein